MLDLNFESNITTIIKHNYRDHVYKILSESDNICKSY